MTAIQLIAISIIAALFILDVAAIVYILIKKIVTDRIRVVSRNIASKIAEEFPSLSNAEITRMFTTRRRRRMLLDQYVEIRQSLCMSDELDRKIRSVFEEMGMIEYYCRRLGSVIRFRRIEAAVYLGTLGGDKARVALENRLKKEKKSIVKLYTAHALSEIGDPASVMLLVESLIGAPEWYQSKVRLFISDYGYEIKSFLSALQHRTETEVRLLLATIGEQCVGNGLADYLEGAIDDTDTRVRHMAANAFTKYYPDSSVTLSLLSNDDTRMRLCAIEALGKKLSRENVVRLLNQMEQNDVAEHAVRVLSGMCARSHMLLEFVMHRYNDESFQSVRHRIIEVLANQVEYFIVRLNSVDKPEAETILEAMLENGFVNTIFGFLARNRNREIENALLALIKKKASEDTKTELLARQFLNERMLKKTGLQPGEEDQPDPGHGTSVVRRGKLYAQLAGILLFFPLLFLIRHNGVIGEQSLLWCCTRYILDGNYYLIFYSTAISSIYLMLLFFSAIGSLRQYAYARVKKRTFLFRRNILPGISVIGPAFNEEATIVESVNSLLNLQYPDHEVIIVNDGSKDHTLHTLIEYFKLEKVDVVIRKDLPTRPIRGIYRTRSLPKLTVVDKLNGGKADSLNAGINIARKEYFCGIDADSLLSQDALVKVVSGSLDLGVETIAVGGNIFPVNGCEVNRGVLEKIRTPRNHLANFQFIEYIRAFMAGRIGWAFIDSLLIISGAFGLFKRSRVVECGGYLTKSGKYGRDTVGEDMELVVRLSRYMKDNRLSYKIGYSHNANCWTEVPESLRILLKQRDRWHRGLIEILSVHENMFARPRYGRIGWVALPYFVLFEVLGPWVELQGYCMVAGAAVLGLLNLEMALLLFCATIMLGVFISIASLIIAEQEMNYLSFKDVLKLIGYAIVENFGFRQLMSLWRVMGYISMLRGTSGWGTMVRQGFASRKST